MEHDQLITEMSEIEKLTTQERLRLARKRRGLQLKRWAQREREYNLKRKEASHEPEQSDTARINFEPAVMLLEAAARNDIDEVRRLLRLNVTPDSTNEDGLTALHQCCIDDSEEMMKVLVEFGADCNAADSEQWTPLHAAATCGHLHLVKFLIDNGANLLAVNGDGNMPYDICEDETTLSYIENEMARRGVTQELIDTTRAKTETLMLNDLMKLAQVHADLEYRDLQGATPLHIAAANGYLSVLEFLLDHHCSTEVCDVDLWQPLHAAACWGHLEAVEILSQNGADISAVTRSGETPFDITEDPEIKERLVELAEQRLRLSEPRVRRGRSASTRTHSIRRTSLRDKMKTTKKDVTEEGLMYVKTVNKTTDDDAELHTTTDIVDPKDVHIILPPSSYQKPVQVVNPIPQEHSKPSPKSPPSAPVRPSRTNQDRRLSSPLDDNQNLASVNSRSPVITSISKPNAVNNSQEPINIHVSVTINNPNMVNNSNSSYHSPPGTLADLKRSRSQSRVSGSGSHSSMSSSSETDTGAGVNMNPGNMSGSISGSDTSRNMGNNNNHSGGHPNSQQHPTAAATVKSVSPAAGRRKFAASSNEIVGPPAKSGCCQIL